MLCAFAAVEPLHGKKCGENPAEIAAFVQSGRANDKEEQYGI